MAGGCITMPQHRAGFFCLPPEQRLGLLRLRKGNSGASVGGHGCAGALLGLPPAQWHLGLHWDPCAVPPIGASASGGGVCVCVCVSGLRVEVTFSTAALLGAASLGWVRGWLLGGPAGTWPQAQGCSVGLPCPLGVPPRVAPRYCPGLEPGLRAAGPRLCRARCLRGVRVLGWGWEQAGSSRAVLPVEHQHLPQGPCGIRTPSACHLRPSAKPQSSRIFVAGLGL